MWRIVVCRGAGCPAVFYICGACYRGQAYCGARCRAPAQRQHRRDANARHQRSPEGRLDHRDRQRVYRAISMCHKRSFANVEGLSERAAARRFGLARETVRKMLRYSVPPGYRRAQPVRCPKLDGFTGVIDQILGDDQQRPKKQRHTAKRIWERLRAEHAFTGIVRLTLRPAQCRDEHSPAPLPSTSLSARHHQPCRLALPQILHELPGC